RHLASNVKPSPCPLPMGEGKKLKGVCDHQHVRAADKFNSRWQRHRIRLESRLSFLMFCFDPWAMPTAIQFNRWAVKPPLLSEPPCGRATALYVRGLISRC